MNGDHPNYSIVKIVYHSHIHEYAKCTWDVHNIYI